MVQQAIVPRNGQAALSTNVIGLEGAEGFSRSDLRVPVLKVVQGTSRMEEAEKHIGEFHNSITGEFTPTLDVVILSWQHTRAKFEVGGSQDRPECVSRDCVTGSKFGACRGCDFNAQVHSELWNDDRRDDRCSLGYYLMVLLPDEGLPATFTAQKTNTNAIKIINTRTIGKRLPLWGITWTLSTVKRTEGNKKWFELTARLKVVNSPEQIAEYRDYAETLKHVVVEEVDDEPTAHSAPPSDDAPGYDDDEVPAGQPF